MLQDFAVQARPEQGPPRLAALREAMAAAGLAGFLVPRADAHQGEVVAPADERLSWLSGFTGSAGFAAVLADRAALFVDGRYRLQARAQTDAEAFEIEILPAAKLHAWLAEAAGEGASVGFDPWLHTLGEVERLRRKLDGSGVRLVESDNLVDAIWSDRPAPPEARAWAHPEDLAGRPHDDKRRLVGEALSAAGDDAALLTLPDSIAWLLNIRGADIPRIPIVQAFAVIAAGGEVDLFSAPGKLKGVADHLGRAVRVHPPQAFASFLRGLAGRVRIDRDSAPFAAAKALREGPAELRFGADPCALPKARKNSAEIAGAQAAHLRDGAAMVRFLAWLDGEAADRADGSGQPLTEIEAVRALEGFRAGTGRLRDIAFDTIAGSGPNGAIVHYRVTEASDRALGLGELFLCDSGGQYADGTTDVTRTIPIGAPSEPACTAFTRVLQGLIAMSRLRWPKGLAGRDIEAVARLPLWLAGQDYDHGTGHGVGSYLSVHEGPAGLSRRAAVPLEAGMILSVEPGYYREGRFGIRIENLCHVIAAPQIQGADDRDMLAFATLTHVPIDRRLILTSRLTLEERAWVDAYHGTVRRMLAPEVSGAAHEWLLAATEPLSAPT